MKLLKWLDDYLEEALLVILLLCMVAIMGIQVFCRYSLKQSLTWSEELTRYLFVWAGFISISYCVKKKISIKITQFEQMLPEKTADYIDIVRNVLLLLFCVYMVPFCVRYLQQCVNNGSTSSSLGIPMYFVQSAPLVGFSMVSVRLLQCILEAIHNLREGGRMF
ncbi:MAG: TRAP transporter small permease [Oscillospiraceae bacterium]|nr:TRAP transporter small permease [Oscillospiraceae bacterium]